MKIAFLCTSESWGGLEMNVVKLADNLSREGLSVTIFTVKDTKIHLNTDKNLVNCRLLPKHRKYFDLFKARRFAKILNREGIRILLFMHSNDTEFASNTKLFYPDLKIIYHQNMHVGRKKKDFFHNIRFARYDYWICPLNLLADEVKNLTNFPPDKVRIIPIGADSKRIEMAKSKIEYRKILNINQEGFYFGIIGRIDKQKGQMDLLRAYNEIKDIDKDIKILIMGEPTIGESGEYFREIKEYIVNNHLSDFVFLRSYSKEVSNFYGAVDCFVLTSKSETYGMVTIEAMLSGVPVIAGSGGGTKELLEYGKYGSLYKSGVISQLAVQMKDMLNNYDKKLKKAVLAQSYALHKYTDTIETQMFIDFFKSII
ncbi:MAG: glycosyltransferase [Candidatus Kapabacteria bacterium]|nr:glycosyltransferase [Candidatus Kapabacteria bacterium]